MISKISNNIRTRFAPSPTGFLHLGGVRTALFSWAFARHHGGTFVLRIEDTDLKRSSEKSLQSILEGINWLGINPDEGPIFQANRKDRYKEIIQKMLKEGSAYYCYSSPDELEKMRKSARLAKEKPRYDETWRPESGKILPRIPKDRNPVIRFRNPKHGSVTWVDLIRGPISFQNNELDDLIIVRSDEIPTYNFCSAMDDWDMSITHVLRGEDHINNTPRQINILKAINAQIPQYGHLPIILDKSGGKLSKRSDAVDIMEYRNEGYLPDAIINYLARLGWSHGNSEIFSRDKLIENFDIKHISKSSACWDIKKLNWINSHYIRNIDIDILNKLFQSFISIIGMENPNMGNLVDAISLFRNRVSTLKELADNVMPLYQEPFINQSNLLERYTNSLTKKILNDFYEKSSKINWTRENISNLIKTILVKHEAKMLELAIPVRIILTGKTQTPPLEDILFLLGKEKVLSRLSSYKL